MTDGFYRSVAGPFQQGDLLIAPFLRALSLDAPAPLDSLGRDGRLLEGVPHVGSPDGEVAGGVVDLRVCAVVSHDCHLDKQFNRELDRLRRHDVPLRQAREQAEADPTLDRWIVVSPLVPFEELTADVLAVQRGDAVGLFHVPANEDIDLPEAAIDLSLKCTVDRFLTKRIAGMTEEAADGMRMELLRVDLARRSKWEALEGLIGAKIRDVVVEGGSPLQARLVLSNDEELVVAHPPQRGGTAGASRTDRSAP